MKIKKFGLPPLPQDLHIHTVYSTGDASVVPQQTIKFIAELGHADIVGISDHFEYLVDGPYEDYIREIRLYNLHSGTEVNGYNWAYQAIQFDFEYYIYHCKDEEDDYRGAEVLLSTGKPVIIAHPLILGTDFKKVPPECFIEINNRYVWRNDWMTAFGKIKDQFRFIISSDAHQPNWLNQNIARHVAWKLGIREQLLFSRREEIYKVQ